MATKRFGRLHSRSMRYLAPVIGACLLAGCAGDVAMVNPRNGETATCRESPLNPWSQQEACIGGYIAQGWKRASQD